MFSGAIDLYTHVKYRNLEEELSAISQMECVASAGKLKELAGCCKMLRSVEVKHVDMIKLEWLCEVMHWGFWYSSIYAAGMSTNYTAETALVLAGISHHQFLLL